MAEAMMENNSLRVLDLSINSLGGCEDATEIWCRVIRRNNLKILLHWDLSYNKFTVKEC